MQKKKKKLAQKEYRSRHDWTENVIYLEVCKRLKFDHTDKPQNLTRKIRRDFDI